MEFKHFSVMKNEVIKSLNIKSDGIYVDGTLGGGGHSFEIAKRLGETGRLICIDRDSDAIAYARERLAEFGGKITFVKENYSNIKTIINELEIDSVDGIILDLGVSSYQIDNEERGFSYTKDAPLDMRMDREQMLTAETVVNEFDKDKLKEILYEYGEEKFTDLIVKGIIKQRETKRITTTGELSETIKEVFKKIRYDGGHPAKRTFQAIRIYVNDELSAIEPTLEASIGILAKNGILSLLTFHSLEDRIVKKTFVKNENPCTCPPDFPVCVCGKKPKIKIITKKPIYPTKEETTENSRSESAKLRTAMKL